VKQHEYDLVFERIAALHVPWMDWRRLRAQAVIESHLQPDAISPAGAIGVMQIMPGTGRDLGYTESDLKNPEKNIDAGIRYMKNMWGLWKSVEDPEERWKFALGSYNAGYGHIKAAVNKARRAHFEHSTWSCVTPVLGQVTGRHARETINYVARVVRIYRIMTGEIS
jgi:membrane-bound lytic murein transglycosylase F